jgi:uncharacterized membrane protein
MQTNQKKELNNFDNEGYVKHNPFGLDHFGAMAEKFARFFGTPKFLIGQSIFVVIWITYNCFQNLTFDPYPFILLNLAFSTQAAYAAPLILLAQTRQADRDKVWEKSDAEHRELLHKDSSRTNKEILLRLEKIEELIFSLKQKK